MKRAIYTLASILCLLTLVVGSTCIITGAPQQQSCNHCPKHTPVQQPATSCCTSHHQPSSTTASAHIERPTADAFVVSDLLPPPVLTTAQLRDSLALSPPPLPPLIALRI